MNRYEELMQEMLQWPDQIFVCIVNYQDGSSRAFTFSIEENLAEFIQYIEECGESMNVISYVFYDSLLDIAYDHEYNFLTTEH